MFPYLIPPSTLTQARFSWCSDKWEHLFDSTHPALLAAVAAAFSNQTAFNGQTLCTPENLTLELTRQAWLEFWSVNSLKTGPFGQHPNFYPGLIHRIKGRNDPASDPKCWHRKSCCYSSQPCSISLAATREADLPLLHLYLHSQLHYLKTQDGLLVSFLHLFSFAPSFTATIPPRAVASCQPVAKRPPSIAFSAQA